VVFGLRATCRFDTNRPEIADLFTVVFLDLAMRTSVRISTRPLPQQLGKLSRLSEQVASGSVRRYLPVGPLGNYKGV
jgi:hypothetical protein